MIPGSEVGGDSRASSAETATEVTLKRGSIAKIASMRNWTSGSSSMTTRIFADACSSTPSFGTIESPLVIEVTSLRAAGSLERLDLLPPLNHFESTLDGHFLEPLELCQAHALPGLLLGDLPLGLHLAGHVAGGGEHGEYVAAGVAIDRGVVQDLGEGPVLVAHGQRVVHGHPLAEHQLVDPVGLRGLGEVVGEVGPDERVAEDSGDLDGGLVDVGDLVFGADLGRRVQARLDHGPGGI